MFEDDLMAYLLEGLAREIADNSTPAPDPLPADTYVARSALQKAIRRNMLPLALRAAAQLLRLDGRVLWRRLLVTALEDIGPAEADLMARITAAWGNRSWRQDHGGDWPVAAELIRQTCSASHCQSANDIFNIAANDPALNAFKESLCDATVADLVDIATDEAREIGERGVVILLMMGDDVGTAAPDHIRPDPGALFEGFSRSGSISHVSAAYRIAHQQTRLTLAPLGLALWQSATAEDAPVQDDDLTPVTWLGEVPALTYDQYTAAGKAALRRYVRESAEWKAFADRAGVRPDQYVEAAGELLFRIEGAQLASRRQWQEGLNLLSRSASLGCFMPAGAVDEGRSLLRRQLPLIDHLRPGPHHISRPG